MLSLALLHFLYLHLYTISKMQLSCPKATPPSKVTYLVLSLQQVNRPSVIHSNGQILKFFINYVYILSLNDNLSLPCPGEIYVDDDLSSHSQVTKIFQRWNVLCCTATYMYTSPSNICFHTSWKDDYQFRFRHAVVGIQMLCLDWKFTFTSWLPVAVHYILLPRLTTLAWCNLLQCSQHNSCNWWIFAAISLTTWLDNLL